MVFLDHLQGTWKQPASRTRGLRVCRWCICRPVSPRSELPCFPKNKKHTHLCAKSKKMSHLKRVHLKVIGKPTRETEHSKIRNVRKVNKKSWIFRFTTIEKSCGMTWWEIRRIYIYHAPPKPTCLEVCMVNNLVFRWPKPSFFMVLGAHGKLT